MFAGRFTLEDVEAAFRVLEPVIEEISVSLGEPTRARFSWVLDVLVSSLGSGCFPHRPGAANFASFDHCRFCDYDALCPSDRAERWEATASVPALASYRELVEGDLPCPEEGLG